MVSEHIIATLARSRIEVRTVDQDRERASHRVSLIQGDTEAEKTSATSSNYFITVANVPTPRLNHLGDTLRLAMLLRFSSYNTASRQRASSHACPADCGRR